MKYATIAARVLLGVVFVFFGANSVVHFLPNQAPPGDAGLFATLMQTHGYTGVIGVIEIVGGLLVLVGRFVPLGLVLLGPILVNVLMFHLLFGVPGAIIGAVCTLLEVFLIFAYWPAFRGLFSAGAPVTPAL